MKLSTVKLNKNCILKKTLVFAPKLTYPKGPTEPSSHIPFQIRRNVETSKVQFLEDFSIFFSSNFRIYGQFGLVVSPYPPLFAGYAPRQLEQTFSSPSILYQLLCSYGPFILVFLLRSMRLVTPRDN